MLWHISLYSSLVSSAPTLHLLNSGTKIGIIDKIGGRAEAKTDKKKQMEILKSTKIEMKNSLEVLNGRFEVSGEKISELKIDRFYVIR